MKKLKLPFCHSDPVCGDLEILNTEQYQMPNIKVFEFRYSDLFVT